MKVLSVVDHGSWKYECTCGFCSTKMEGNIEDLKLKMEQKFSCDDDGGYYYDAELFYFCCPICGKDVAVNYCRIPNMVLEKLRKKK